MKNLKSRNELPRLLNHLGLRGEGAEVGVAEAYNSWNILDNWPGTLYMIDAWRLLDAPGFSGHGENTQEGQDARYQRILDIAAKYKGRAQVVRLTSEQAASAVSDHSLNFVYLDADHSPAGIRADIELWHRKVKPGGIFSGHDFLDNFHNGQEYGVKTAVTEFAAERGLNVMVTQETDWPSWVIRL